MKFRRATAAAYFHHRIISKSPLVFDWLCFALHQKPLLQRHVSFRNRFFALLNNFGVYFFHRIFRTFLYVGIFNKLNLIREFMAVNFVPATLLSKTA